ncbi:hypothetical protein [Pseudomonas aeruginosa]|uniref:hypothetical protein n=1 Tax=Pseudomonas aeruginosa TaxID=287 RepID=UPI00232E71E6|nr:hypothetical protein [Pseudomonas aeruginosa]
MSNELTDVRCPCGAEFQADSYDAGFIAGSCMCQNCDAALPPKDICTCPSGDGSLVHPCPAHPAPVEQAGGDERDFQAKGAQEVPSPVSKEYDRHLIGLLRKGEALPGHQEEAADEIERLRDWNDHLNNTVLPNILNPNFLMLMKGGERLLDLCTKDGKFIGVSLNDMKDVFDWMVTHARIAPDHAALAQPSPKCATCNGTGLIDDGEITCSEGGIPYENGPVKCVKDCPDCKAQPSPAQAEQAEAERPEVVAWRYGFSGGIVSDKACLDEWKSGGEYQSLMTVAQHERIVGVLRAKIAQLRQHKNDYMDSGQETYRALQNEIREREAEIARLDGLVSGRTAERDAALAEVERLRESKGDPVGSLEKCMKVMYERDEHAKRLEAALARVAGLEAELETERMRLAGCGVAALGYFDGCADAYKSASLSDVLRLRADCDAALAEVAGLRSLLNSLLCYVERDINRMRSDRDKSDNKEIYDRSISLAMERLKAAQNAVFTTEPGCDTAVELAAQTTQAQHSVPEEFSFEYRHPNGECHTVTVSREQVINEMPDFLFEALCSKFCNCEPVGETNVVECCCDEYAEEFKLIAAAPGNSAQHSVPEGWKLVPEDATLEMVEALKAELVTTSKGGILRAGIALNAAIAAAPGKEGL